MLSLKVGEVCSLTLVSYNDGKAAYLKKYDYRSVIARIDIIFLCYIVYHMVSTSAFNEDDDRCRKYIKILWVFCRYHWYNEKGFWVVQDMRIFKGCNGKIYLLDVKKQWTYIKVSIKLQFFTKYLDCYSKLIKVGFLWKV